jgi:alpha-ribazole phosphatase
MIEPPPRDGARLILVRHAEPDDTARGRICGRLDAGLSARGRAQAERLAGSLAGHGIVAVYTSPRVRARETVARVPPRAIVVDDLREIDFGALEGMTYDEAAARHPEVYRCWMERPTEVAFPDGEQYGDLRRRVRSAASAIVAAHPRSCVLVAAHGGTIRTLLAEALGMADRDIFRVAVDHASISVIDRFADGTPLVRLVNASS